MSSSAQLHLFPSTATSMPRKSSLKKPKPTNTSTAPGELKGVAFQVSPPSGRSSPQVQPANDQIKHSLFCDTAIPPEHISQKSTPTQHSYKRKQGPGSAASPTPSSATKVSPSTPLSAFKTSPSSGEDKLTPLIESGHFGTTNAHGRRSPAHSKRPSATQNVSSESQAGSEPPVPADADRLSPLPGKDRWVADSPARSNYAPSFRSQSPTLVRSNSAASSRPPAYQPPMRSIFPQYNPNRPLNQQQYYPSSQGPSSAPFPVEKPGFSGSPAEKRPEWKRFDSGTALVEGYEHIPMADNDDLLTVWNASCGHTSVKGRKVQFKLHQPPGRGMSLAIGLSPEQQLYSMSKVSGIATEESPAANKELAIRKHCPHEPASTPVAQIPLPAATEPSTPPPKDKSKDKGKFPAKDASPKDAPLTLFPHIAAINALNAIAASPSTQHLAQADPNATSPKTARLARTALSLAHTRHTCTLTRASRRRDSLGAVTATHNLDHPTLGRFPITVTKATLPPAGPSSAPRRDTRAKISLHHPSATPAAIAAETLVLAFLDFSRDACVLDVPGLLALESAYVVDTVLSALLAVAVVENDDVVRETLVFEPPPRVAVKDSGSGAGAENRLKLRSEYGGEKGKGKGMEVVKGKRSKRWLGAKRKAPEKPLEEQDLPVATQAALLVLGLSFKTAVALLEAGVKVGAGVVMGATHLAKKA